MMDSENNEISNKARQDLRQILNNRVELNSRQGLRNEPGHSSRQDLVNKIRPNSGLDSINRIRPDSGRYAGGNTTSVGASNVNDRTKPNIRSFSTGSSAVSVANVSTGLNTYVGSTGSFISYVNTEEMENIADELPGIIDDLEAEFDALFTRLTNVPEVTKEWIGGQANYYFTTVADDARYYANMVETLREIVQEIRHEAGEIQAAIIANNTE